MTGLILTPHSFDILPQYVDIFNRVMSEITPFYTSEIVEEARKLYTVQNIREDLVNPTNRRYIANFSQGLPNGLLIESFDETAGLSRTAINWVMTEQKGTGIGTKLVEDSIGRAGRENKDIVVLGVSTQNQSARKLYERLGFHSGGTYRDGLMEVMGIHLR